VSKKCQAEREVTVKMGKAGGGGSGWVGTNQDRSEQVSRRSGGLEGFVGSREEVRMCLGRVVRSRR